MGHFGGTRFLGGFNGKPTGATFWRSPKTETPIHDGVFEAKAPALELEGSQAVSLDGLW